MKKTHHHLVFLFLCVTLFAGFSFAQKRAITEKDLFQFRWIGDPQLSPDGTQVAFVRIAVDDKREDYETSIWSVSMNGGGLRRLTADKHDTSPQWSPNGKFLAFVRTLEKDGKPQPPQIFILPMEGGEGWQLTHLPKGASGPVWSPDGKTLAFSSSTNAEDLAKAACDEGKEKEKDKEKDKEKSKCTKPGHEPDIHVVTRAEYRVNGQGYIDFSRQDHIWSIAFPSGAQDLPQPKQLTSGDFDEAEIAGHVRPPADARDGGNRPLGRVDRALQPDRERFRGNDGGAELGTLAWDGPVRAGFAVAHRFWRPDRDDRGAGIGSCGRHCRIGDGRWQRLFRR